MTAFEHACRASRGARRYQEDSAVVWPGRATYQPDGPQPPAVPGLLAAVLADGMGGHAGGALASATACARFLNCYTQALAEGPAAEAFASGDAARAFAYGRALLHSALDAANAAIALTVAADPALEGMGSTLVGVAVHNSCLTWVSVGDSPLYLYRDGEVALLNADHSLAPALDQLAAEGRMTAEQARNDPRRHMLRSAVTGEPLDLVDLSENPLRLEPGDLILLASDGIHTLETADIARIARAYAPEGVAAIAEALLREVDNQRDPHQDNTTLIVIAATG